MVAGNICGDAVGAVVGSVANPVVECIDVNGVVRRIDLNAALARIDLNAVLDRVDLDRHLSRVDFNRILQRVDVNDIIGRSDLGAIIAQSTTGVFGSVLDTLRTQLVLVDLVLFRIARFRWQWSGHTLLPPRPSKSASYVSITSSGVETSNGAASNESAEPPQHYPRGKFAKAVAVQGRYTGFFSKAVAIFIDVGLVTVVFAVLMIIIQLCWILFTPTSKEDAQQKVDRSNLWVLPFYCVFWWLWFFLAPALVSQTLGMSIAGIKVVHSNRDKELSACQVAIRTTLLPISLTLMPFLGAIGFFRKDGRMLHDIVARTGIVYSWNARMAELRDKAENQMVSEYGESGATASSGLLSEGGSQPTYT